MRIFSYWLFAASMLVACFCLSRLLDREAYSLILVCIAAGVAAFALFATVIALRDVREDREGDRR